MVKGLIAFCLVALMTVVANGQSFYGTNNLAEVVLGDAGDTLIQFDFATASYTTIGAIGGGLAFDVGFGGLDWPDSTGTGDLIGCVSYGSPGWTPDFYSIDPTDASATLIGSSVVAMTDLSLNKFDNKMYSIDDADVVYRDDNGDSIPETIVGTLPIGGLNVGLGFDDNGDLYVQDVVTDSIYMVPSADVQAGDLSTNISTVVDSAAMNYDSNFSQGLTFSGGVGYHAAINNTLVTAENYTFNANGNYTFVSEFPIDLSTGFPEVEVGDLTLIPSSNIVTVRADSITIFRGILVSGVLSDTFENDGNRMRFNPGFTINSAEAPVWLIFDGNAGTGATSIEVEVDSQAGTPNLAYTVELFNWNTNLYDIIGVTGESFGSDTTETFPGIVANHIDVGGEVRSRIGWRRIGFLLNYPWEVRLDRFVWNVGN